MKPFKQFLEESANSIRGIRDSGHKLYKGGREAPTNLPSGMTGYGWRIKKAKLSKDDKLMIRYKDINNPKKPSEADLLKGTGVLPITKA